MRADFPYRKEGRRAPDRPPKLMAAVREELAAIDDDVIVVGGRSMGGRICSMVAAGADGEPPPATVAGVVAISYPLHPPGKPDTLRVEHLPAITVPCLFVHGTKDPFGTPDELTRVDGDDPRPGHPPLDRRARVTTSRAATPRSARPWPPGWRHSADGRSALGCAVGRRRRLDDLLDVLDRLRQRRAGMGMPAGAVQLDGDGEQRDGDDGDDRVARCCRG